mmetsp:Transcript_16582/g.63031  ORF Transcript_16582/g.63031 Transcript_16582/m.63031 type:complete len:263 (-) Transcript_16582:1387-2175(-)
MISRRGLRLRRAVSDLPRLPWRPVPLLRPVPSSRRAASPQCLQNRLANHLTARRLTHLNHLQSPEPRFYATRSHLHQSPSSSSSSCAAATMLAGAAGAAGAARARGGSLRFVSTALRCSGSPRPVCSPGVSLVIHAGSTFPLPRPAPCEPFTKPVDGPVDPAAAAGFGTWVSVPFATWPFAVPDATLLADGAFSFALGRRATDFEFAASCTCEALRRGSRLMATRSGCLGVAASLAPPQSSSSSASAAATALGTANAVAIEL